MRIPLTLDIACTPEQLWPWIEEPDRQKQWMRGLVSNESTTPGPTQVGSRFRMRIREGRRENEYEGEITAYDRPRHICVRMYGGNFPQGMAVLADYQLSAINGHTRLDYLCSLEAARVPLWMRLMMPLFKTFASWQAKSFLKSLKRLAEAEYA